MSYKVLRLIYPITAADIWLFPVVSHVHMELSLCERILGIESVSSTSGSLGVMMKDSTPICISLLILRLSSCQGHSTM